MSFVYEADETLDKANMFFFNKSIFNYYFIKRRYICGPFLKAFLKFVL